jgi:hypothetical protein
VAGGGAPYRVGRTPVVRRRGRSRTHLYTTCDEVRELDRCGMHIVHDAVTRLVIDADRWTGVEVDSARVDRSSRGVRAARQHPPRRRRAGSGAAIVTNTNLVLDATSPR